jgi:hypothetical protein
METMTIIWLLSIQLWTDPPPAIKIVYTKEYQTHEECMQEREKWDKKFVSLCLMITKKNV